MRQPLNPPQSASGFRHRNRKATIQSASKFYIVLLIGVVIAICLHLQILSPQASVHKRDLEPLETSDEACRLVHSAADQCKFIKQHCPLDEAGFSAYLDLYFCQLPHVKPIAFLVLALWLGLLFSTIGIAASDFFCVDLSTIAKILGMSESMAGVTLLAFGNGSPDVFSTFAAMSTDTGDLAVGELMGAAGFITAVVAGSMAIIRPFKVSKKSFVRDVCFFAVAAAFTMVILSDGILHLWECLAMIGYYVFYVSFVLFWHWIEARRKRKYDTEAAARGHFTAVFDGTDTEHQPYSDEPDVDPLHPPTLRMPSQDDFAALERSNTEEEEEGNDDDEDYSDEERDRWLTELNTNMRLARPATRMRSKTIAPVRPSLFGALEFQSVLKTLQRSRNLTAVPQHSRRFSDDPNLTLYNVQTNHHAHRRASVTPGLPAARPSDLDAAARQQRLRSQSNAKGVSIQPPSIEVSYSSPQQAPTRDIPQLTIVPPATRMTPQSANSEPLILHRALLKNLNSPSLSPQGTAHILLPSPPRSRAATRTARSPTSPFPTYRDQPLSAPVSPIEHLALPPPVVQMSPDTLSLACDSEAADMERPHSRTWRYWPYTWLSSPEEIACVLFPTIVDWNGKSWWAKSLGVVAAPSVFLLTISLPVVESDHVVRDVQEIVMPTTGSSSHLQPAKLGDTSSRGSTSESVTPTQKSSDALISGTAGMGTTAAIAVHQELSNGLRPATSHTTEATEVQLDDDHDDKMQQPGLDEDWPRWLLLLQLYTAPMTIILAFWVQSPESLPYAWLVRPGLVSLLISTILLVPVLLTTTPSYRPRQYRWILSIVGFAVSIAWISTVASQVVGTLKALAVILNWSNAIMGLTIFAVGNSVGDLVADMTVANLGYPVMALSACFGGPMLNILLGIGLSGTYTILNGADRRKHKHPEKGYRIKSYHLDVGQTLIVSGVALLITLLGVLILVPLSKWMMTRKIGIALIVIWILSTIGNVVIEVTGIADVSTTH